MKNIRRRSQLYYIPGILTLAIAPIIFVVNTNKYLSYITEHCISIVVGSYKESQKDWQFPNEYNQVYRLNGQTQHDSLTLILIENYSRGLNLSKNDSVGIKVILEKTIKYKTFIALLNSCLKSGINNWIPFRDTVFIYYKTPPKDYHHEFSQNYMMADIIWGNDVVNMPKPKPILIQNIVNHRYEIKLTLPFAILYLIMVYLTIRKIKNEG